VIGKRSRSAEDLIPATLVGLVFLRTIYTAPAHQADEDVRVVVFDSAVDDYFPNHSDFLTKLEDLTGMPAGPTGLPPWPDFLVRLSRLPVASIALIRTALQPATAARSRWPAT
jgi:hypothetical protein